MKKQLLIIRMIIWGLLLVQLQVKSNTLDKDNPKTTNKQDSFALVAIYNATNGGNRGNNTNWLIVRISNSLVRKKVVITR